MSFQKSGGCDNFRNGTWGHITRLYDLAVAVSRQRNHDLSHPDNAFATGIKWGDFHLGNIYNDWLRCVADQSAEVKLYWIEKHGGYKNCPDIHAFIDFVHHWDDPGPWYDKLKDW